MQDAEGQPVGSPRLITQLGPWQLRSPILAASGCFGYGREYAAYLPLQRLGGIVTKGTSLKPRLGDLPPRMVETPAGMLNAIGLQNPGIETVIQAELPFLHRYGVPVIVNLYGTTPEEYAELAARLDGVEGVWGIELNISCPNVAAGGILFGQSPILARQVTEAAKRATHLPVMVKLSPNVTSIVEIARAVEDGGADLISLTNTFRGMAIDLHRRRPVLGNLSGGLSGPAIRPLALQLVWEVAGTVQIPVVGIGGIVSGDDAAAFLMAGASAVQVGTAQFIDPTACVRIADELEATMNREGFAQIADMVGAARQ
ncbi:MAG: dihydroorotate dehydrogenase [Firmicutes bacterium]|nr:dihydroorotate dehydrogenase [Bacillota bacterium]